MREAIGPWPALRVDANGAWSLDEAVAAIADAGAATTSSWSSSPAARWRSWRSCAPRSRSRWPPTSRSPAPDDVRVAAELRACDAVNVKLAAAGGYGPAREALRAAREQRLEPACPAPSTAPGASPPPCSWPPSERLSLACGLATLELFDARLARVLPRPRNGLMAVPQGPGLGVERVRPTLWPRCCVEEVPSRPRHGVRALELGRVARVLDDLRPAAGQLGAPSGGRRSE